MEFALKKPFVVTNIIVKLKLIVNIYASYLLLPHTSTYQPLAYKMVNTETTKLNLSF